MAQSRKARRAHYRLDILAIVPCKNTPTGKAVLPLSTVVLIDSPHSRRHTIAEFRSVAFAEIRKAGFDSAYMIWGDVFGKSRLWAGYLLDTRPRCNDCG